MVIFNLKLSLKLAGPIGQPTVVRIPKNHAISPYWATETSSKFTLLYLSVFFILSTKKMQLKIRIVSVSQVLVFFSSFMCLMHKYVWNNLLFLNTYNISKVPHNILTWKTISFITAISLTYALNAAAGFSRIECIKYIIFQFINSGALDTFGSRMGGTFSVSENDFVRFCDLGGPQHCLSAARGPRNAPGNQIVTVSSAM